VVEPENTLAVWKRIKGQKGKEGPSVLSKYLYILYIILQTARRLWKIL
jgi:hypothetical protein